MNYKWKLEPPTPEKLEAAERLAKELNISPILGRLLIERNIATVAELIIDCSRLRHESRGLHYNADYPKE